MDVRAPGTVSVTRNALVSVTAIVTETLPASVTVSVPVPHDRASPP